jgi:hypothetical protein
MIFSFMQHIHVRAMTPALIGVNSIDGTPAGLPILSEQYDSTMNFFSENAPLINEKVGKWSRLIRD